MIGTASEIDRLWQCPGPLTLPRAQEQNEATERGNWRHAYLEKVATVGVDAALAAVPEEYRAICEALPIDDLPVNLAAEVALGMDLNTGKARELGRGLGRKYPPLTRTSIAGTADVIGLSDDRVFVADWKSIGYRIRARDSRQLRFLALAASRAYGRESATVEIVRLADDGQVWRDRHDLDAVDLDIFAYELSAKFLVRGDDTLHVGPWCAQCPSRAWCPPQSAAIVRAASGADLEPLATLPALTPEMVGLVWTKVREQKAILARLEKMARAAIAEFGEAPLPSGGVLRQVVTAGNKEIDGRIAYQVARDLWGQAFAEQAVAVEATEAQLKRAVAELASRGEIPTKTRSKVLREILDAIGERGGITRPTVTRIVEVDPAATEAA